MPIENLGQAPAEAVALNQAIAPAGRIARATVGESQPADVASPLLALVIIAGLVIGLRELTGGNY